MAAPKNAVLLNMKNVSANVDPTRDIWAVTTHMSVPKGTDVEKYFADLVSGQVDPANAIKSEYTFVDLTKIG